MDVELPDGTVVEGVPDGLSQRDLVSMLAKNGHDTSWYKAPEPGLIDRIKTALTPDPNRAPMPSTPDTINAPSGEFDTGASVPAEGAISLPGSVMDGYVPRENDQGMPIDAGQGPMRKDYYDTTRAGLISAPVQAHAAAAKGGGQVGKVARDTLPDRLAEESRTTAGDTTPRSMQELGDQTNATLTAQPLRTEADKESNRQWLTENSAGAIDGIKHYTKMDQADAEAELQQMIKYGVKPAWVDGSMPDATLMQAASANIGATGPSLQKSLLGLSEVAADQPFLQLPWREYAKRTPHELEAMVNDLDKQIRAARNVGGKIESGSWNDVVSTMGPSLAVNLPPLVAAALVSARNPAAGMAIANGGLGVMGAQAFGDAYLKGQMKGLSASDNLTQSALTFAAEVIPEKLSLNALFAVFKTMGKGSAIATLKAFAKEQLTEHSTEQLTTITEHFIDKAYTEPDKSLESLWSDMKQTAMAVAIQAPILAGGGIMAHGAGQAVMSAQQRIAEGRDITAGRDFNQDAIDAAARQALDPANAQMQRQGGLISAPAVPRATPATIPEIITAVTNPDATLGESIAVAASIAAPNAIDGTGLLAEINESQVSPPPTLTPAPAPLPVIEAQPEPVAAPIAAQPAPDASSLRLDETAVAAVPVDSYLTQNAAGKWQLSRPVELAVKDAVIAEMDRRNQEGSTNAPQADQTIKDEQAQATKKTEGITLPSNPHPLGEQPVAAQDSDNGFLADTKAVGNLLSSEALKKQGFNGLDSNAQASVMRHMLRIGENDQVLDSVIKLIPVDVVDMLARQQLTPEMLFHDPSMLKNGGVRGDGNPAVAIPVNASAAIIRAMAGVAAKNKSFFEVSHFGRLPVAQGSTDSTGKLSASPSGAGLIEPSARSGAEGSFAPNLIPLSTEPHTAGGARNLDTRNGDSAAAILGGAGWATEDVGGSSSLRGVAKKLNTAQSTIERKHDVTPSSDVVTGAGDVDAPSAPPIVAPAATAPAITRTKAGKLEISGFTREDVADTLKTAKIAATVTVGKDGRVLVTAASRSGNPAPLSVKQGNAIKTALMGKTAKAPKARKFTGNLRNDVNLLAPGLYAEVARGGDGEDMSIDMSLIAERLRDEGFMLPATETGKDSDAVIEIIRQDIANGGGTLNEARQTAAMTEAEQKAHRGDVLRLANEYGVETKHKGFPRKFTDVEAEVKTAIEQEVEVAGKSLASIREQAIKEGIPATEVDAIMDQVADFYDKETAPDKFVLMYREAANQIQEKIDGNQERQGRDGQGQGAVEHLPPGAGSEERPALELAGQTPEQIRAEQERELAAQAEAHREEVAAIRGDRAARNQAEKDRRAADVIAEDKARRDAELAALQNPDDFEFGADAPAAPAPVIKNVSTEQARGQGDIFAPAAQPKTIAEASLGDLLRAAADKADGKVASEGGKPVATEFIKAPDGSIDFGEITADQAKSMRRQAGKIRLTRGIQNADKTGHGLVHIEANHGKQIRGAGFGSVEEFIAHVAKDFGQIWQATGSQLLASYRDGEQHMMYVQLEPARDESGDYYRVNAAFPVRQEDYPEKHGFKKLWDGSEPASAVAGKQPAFAGVPEVKSGQGTPNARGQGNDNIAQQPEEGNISDFGEKIGGARKDVWSGYKDKLNDAESVDIKAEPLSKSWPAPDYQALIDAGADPWAVAFARAARDEIPRKPSASWKLKSWVANVALLRRITSKLMNGEISTDRAQMLLAEASKTSHGLSDIAGRIELYMLVGHRQSLDGVSISVGQYGVHNGIHYDKPKTIWSVSKKAAASAWSNWPRELAIGDTRKEALDNFKAAYDKLDITPAATKAATFDIYVKFGEKTYFIGKKVGRNHVDLAGPFDTVKEARAYRAEHEADLAEKLEKFKEIPKLRRDVNQPRVGEDMRGGADVTQALFAETFGFKGVEFGNWVEQARRQKDLNDAFDALMDMAAVLGVPPRALSLNGELGLAFGARGTGGIDAAAAHYESNKIVINLTKKNGEGSLGHEFFHALDNYFSRKRGKAGDFTTEALDVSLAGRQAKYHSDGAIRKEMIEAFGTVMRAIRNTALKARSSKLDAKRSKEYWTTDREMAARAFESHLISKLHDNNASNDYLSNIVDEQTWKAAEAMGFELDESYPYPTAGEVPVIRAAFDHFFQTIETKETDKGVMLSEPEKAPYGDSAPAREAGVPASATQISTFRNTVQLKKHKDYAAAKAGDYAAAASLVSDLVSQENISEARAAFGDGALYAYPHAEEASGRNAIPGMLANFYAASTNGEVAEPIIQTNRAYHTGAGMMERMISRPSFNGDVKPGRYVLVDDVSLSGSTLAELSHHITSNGGTVVGVVTLTDASRTATIIPDKRVVRQIKERFGDAITNEFGIKPEALTASEAGYIIGFRDADSLRARVATARRERLERLRSKGVSTSADQGRVESPQAAYADTYDLFETRPGTTDKQRDEGRAALDALESAERRILGPASSLRGNQAAVLGSAISRDFREDGGTSFVGREVTTTGDLALLGQVVRDPRFETFRVFYTDKAGKIIGQGAYSSRLPGVVYLPNDFHEHVAADKARFGASGYWMMHNHPSGRVEASRSDEALTADIADKVPGFAGHVILDNNEYGVVEVTDYYGEGKRGRGYAVSAPELASKDLRSNPEIPHAMLGEKINSPTEFALIGKKLQVDPSVAVLVGVDANNKITLIVEVADWVLGNNPRAIPSVRRLRTMAAVRRAARQTGLSRIFAVVPGSLDQYQAAMRMDFLTDVVDINGKSAAALGRMNGTGALPVTKANKTRLKARASEVGDDDAAENISAGVAAMNRVIEDHQDETHAMMRPDHRWVSFVWGKEGNPARDFAGGHGIAKIIAKRESEGADGEAVARKMVEVIALGEASETYGPKGGERFNVSYDGHTAVLSLHRFGKEETWLLTGWDDVVSGGAEAGNASGAYAPESSGIRNQEGADSNANIANSPEKGNPIVEASQAPYSNPRQQALPNTGATPPAPPTRQTPIGLQGGAPGNNASWNALPDTKLDDVIRTLQDKHIDTKRTVQAIKAAGRQVADKWDVYLQETLFHGRAAKRTLEFVETELTPLAKDLAMRGLSLAELDEYLHARHAEEANALIAQRNPAMPDGGSGMTNQQAQDYFSNLDPAKQRRLDAVAKRVDAIIDNTRQLYVSYGLESKETVDAWADTFDHYVPLMREDKDGGMGIGQGFSIKGKESKSRTGSTRKVVDILANIAMQRERAITRGEKNRVSVSLMGLAKLNPNPDFWQFNKVPHTQTLNPATGLVESHPDPTYKNRENVIVAKISNGKGGVEERAVVFNEENEQAMNMARALKNLDVAQLEGFMGAAAKVTRYFAAINTMYNPVFGVTNLVRDVQDAMLNLSSTPIAGHKADVLKHTIGALRGIYIDIRQMRKGQPATSAYAQLWEEFQHEGGQTGYRDMFRTSADRAHAIERLIDPHGWNDSVLGKIFTAGGVLKVPLNKAQDMAGPLFDWLADYNESMENAVRLAAYKVGKEQGMSKQRAAEMAKSITVNFNRRGVVGQQAGALYAFFNASAQGTGRIAQTLFTIQGNDIKTARLSKAGKAIVAGGILLGSLQALMLAAMGFGDDEPPEFVRERNTIIPIGDKKYITIPMPLGFAVLPNIGRISTEFVLGGFKNPGKHMTRLLGIMADAFNPIGGNGSVLQMVTPTELDPLAAIAENKDWTKKPIAKEAFDKTTPGHKLWKDTASTPSKIIAEAINTMSGGTKHVAGMLSPTPDQIDYLFGQVTGGVGRELSKTEQSIMATVRGEDLPPHKIPLVGRFYGDAGAQSSQATTFYNNINRINEYEAEIKGLRKEGKGADAAKFIAENPEARLVMRANYAEKAVQKRRKEKHDLVEKDAPRERIKQLEDRIKAEMERFNSAVKASKQREKKVA